MLIVASSVDVLSLEEETLEEPLDVNFSLGIRVIVDQICRDCELEILGILLTMDLGVMDISDLNVILSMDWLTTHRVGIECDRRRITTYTYDSIV